jgi:hypothetical protein
MFWSICAWARAVLNPTTLNLFTQKRICLSLHGIKANNMRKKKDTRQFTLPCFGQFIGHTTVCLFLSTGALSPIIMTPSGSSSSISITS